ncbi:hypothetical protein [Chryseobacterium sp. MMS23-Vi53]|uniref:hypothetical protein n=1 Tax=Chryseobacterium sp. MMS23-Vi53 TaxID=3386644 RepID=UPI0039E7EFA6
MNHKIKIALALITGGTLIYLSRKIKSKDSKLRTFTAEDGNTYQENEMYFTADGKVFKNGKQVHFKTPESNENINTKTNFKFDSVPQNYDSQPKNVEYHQKGIRHH